MSKSIMQSWVADLGLRHQGVLVAAVRGCDSVPREDPSKWLVRFYRACIMNAHVGDPRKASSFMVWPKTHQELAGRTEQFLKSLDHYPSHWLMHFVHAAEVVGYCYPCNTRDLPHYFPSKDSLSDFLEAEIQPYWHSMYSRLVFKLHLQQETKEQLDRRLGADEQTFARTQA